jgi:hypothetical protein
VHFGHSVLRRRVARFAPRAGRSERAGLMALPSEPVRSAWLAQTRRVVSRSERSGRMPPAALRLDVWACPVAGPESSGRARVRLMGNSRPE